MWRENALARKRFYDDACMHAWHSSKFYDDPDLSRRFLFSRRRDLVLKLINASEISGSRFLDVGCADGYYVINTERMGADLSVGIDISVRFLKRARDLAKLEKLPNASFICADAENLPFRDKIFDLTLLSEVLEHCPNPSKAIQEFWRISKITCILSIPTGEAFPWVKIIKKFGRFSGIKKEEAGHLYDISFQEAMKMVKELDSEILGINGAVAFYWTLLAYPICQVEHFSRVLARLITGLIPFDVFICRKFPVVSGTVFFWIKRIH